MKIVFCQQTMGVKFYGCKKSNSTLRRLRDSPINSRNKNDSFIFQTYYTNKMINKMILLKYDDDFINISENENDIAVDCPYNYSTTVPRNYDNLTIKKTIVLEWSSTELPFDLDKKELDTSLDEYYDKGITILEAETIPSLLMYLHSQELPVLDELGVLLQNETVPISDAWVDELMDRVNILLEENAEVDRPDKLLHKLDEFGSRLDLEKEPQGQVVRSNFAVLVADADPARRVRGVRLAAAHHHNFTDHMFEFIDHESTFDWSAADSDAVTLLPESVLHVHRRISFVAFRTDTAFQHDRSCELNSLVVGISVENVTTFEEGEMVEIHISPLKRNIPRNQRRVCAFWNFDGNGSGHWSQEGCTLTVTEEEGMLDVCRCNHLTHFAEILITRNVFSELDENILEIISVVGCCLSIIGILIVAATAAAFKTWRANDSNKVWLHLCTAVLFLNICFLITVYTTFEQSGAGCIIIGISLHYSVLATYCWMLVISILSYRKLVLVFTNDISKKLLLSSVFSWGFPMLVIGILLAVDSRAYSGRFEEMTPNGHFCYPKGVALWVTVYGPIGVMWFVNWCLYGIIMRSMSESRNIRKHSKTNEFYRSASVSCLLAFICGIPWVFGFFSWNIIAAYLFTVTVTFQGFVLFLFFVLGSSSTRGLWARALRGKSEEYRTTSSGRTGRSQPPTTRFQIDDSSSMPLTESSRL